MRYYEENGNKYFELPSRTLRVELDEESPSQLNPSQTLKFFRILECTPPSEFHKPGYIFGLTESTEKLLCATP